MFEKNYYCLVAGLKEYSLDSDRKGLDARAIIDEVRAELSSRDERALELFYTYYDISNIVGMRSGSRHISVLGNFTGDELEQELAHPSRLPRFISDRLLAYADSESPEWEDIDTSKRLEKSLFEAYYQECAKSKCRFLREWAAFDCTLRNLLAAYSSRANGMNVAPQLVGADDVTAALARSSSADFGLKGDVDYVEQVMAAVADNGNLIEKEHRIDRIRWSKAEELAEFDYFNINAVLSYLTRINIVHRWSTLDAKRGEEMFRQLRSNFSGREFIVRAEHNAENNN